MIAKTAVEFKVEGVRERLTNLEQWLARAAQHATGEHEVEGHLFREMLAMGAQLLGAFSKLVGPGDSGEEVAVQEGHTVKRRLCAFLEGNLHRMRYGEYLCAG